MAFPSYSSSIITTVTRVQQNASFPQFVIGGRNASAFKLFKLGRTYDFTFWRSPVYRIGKNFDVLKIQFNVLGGITGNKSIIPVLYFDNLSSNSVGTTINTTNFSGKRIILSSKNFNNSVHGKNNFFLEFQFNGTDLTVVKLPIQIEYEIEDI